MKTKVWLGLFSLFGIFSGVLNAQQISAISSIAYQFISGANVHTPAGDLSVVGGASPSIIPNGYYVIVSHSTTQEEYVAQLYYDVGTTGALYYGSSPNLLQTGSVSGNGIAIGAFIQRVGNYGLYSVSTDHYLIAYFVSSVGQYYDPYGFGVTSPVQVDDNGGYWISVTVFATYITAAAIYLGTSYTDLVQSPNPGPTVQFPVLYQAYIPPAYVQGPPDWQSIAVDNCYPVYWCLYTFVTQLADPREPVCQGG